MASSSDLDLKKFIINTISKENYDQLSASGQLQQNQLYLVADAPIESASLPLATPAAKGAVMPVAKDDTMTQEVGVDASGKLYTTPSSGSGARGYTVIYWEDGNQSMYGSVTFTFADGHTEQCSYVSSNSGKLFRDVVSITFPSYAPITFAAACAIGLADNAAEFNGWLGKTSDNFILPVMHNPSSTPTEGTTHITSGNIGGQTWKFCSDMCLSFIFEP